MASAFLWHTQEVSSVAHELNSDLEQGLSNKEAASRFVTYGPNESPETERILLIDIFLRQHISLMIPILVLALIVLIPNGFLNSAAIVIGILVASIILSIFQKTKSEMVLRHLRKLANNSMYAKVLRNGSVNQVESICLVPGDVICFEAGDQIAADGRLVESNQLTVDESSLTGATKSLEKDAAVLDENAPISQRKNMVFMGSMVIGGSGRSIVTATGMQTQAVQILADRATQSRNTPRFLLEANISRKGLWLAGICIVLSAIIWAAVVLLGMEPIAGITVGLSFLFAACPMGLIETVTMSLIMGMKRLSKHQVIIRESLGAEALANTTVICSDKTGIMTQNRMTVKKLFVDGHIISVEGDGYDPESGGFSSEAVEDSPDFSLLLTIASMCTNTEIKNTPEGWNVIGDPTEGALIVAAMKGSINKSELGLSLTKIAELPFDPERKRMSVIFRAPKDELFVFTKGSIETILDVCSNIQLHGYVDNLDMNRRQAIWAVNQSFARDSMRNMAFAYCQLEEEPEDYTIETIEQNLVFAGIMGIADPPRPNTKLAVKKCIAGAVKPIVFTDDYVDTAFAFAQYLGIAEDEWSALKGEELDILGEKKYSSFAERFSAYSDISAAHKLRIVRTLKEKGKFIALIGGNVSDEAAIREADVGIAAGKTGSSVTINASDIILTDDSFVNAVDAIERMRGAYGNARKIVRYLLSGSAAMAGTMLLSLIIRIFWAQLPFPPLSFLHILWISLLAGSIPAFAIAFNPTTDGVMKEGPYERGEIFGEGLGNKIAIRGILITLLALIAYAFSLGYSTSWQINQGVAMTAAFTTLMMSQLVFAFQCRSTPGEGFFRKFISNKLLLIITFVVILLHFSIIYITPVSQIFGTKPLSLIDWIPILVALVICSLPLDDIFKNRMVADGERDEVVEENMQGELKETANVE